MIGHMFGKNLKDNRTVKAIVINMVIAAVSLFFNGFGVYLTIQANIGAGPWDVLNLGISNTFGILYGTASIAVSYAILGLDVILKEPIGIAMFIDALVVGKAVDFFNRIGAVDKCDSLVTGVPVMIIGLMALAKRAKKIPIGAVSICLLGLATLVGWLLGGPVGIGTIICAFGTGPIMQFAFSTVKFDATYVKHQHLAESAKVFIERCR